MNSQLWSYLLAAVGVSGLLLAGRRNALGWLICFGALWAIYATVTNQPGFYISAAAYGMVYFRNWRAWRREQS